MKYINREVNALIAMFTESHYAAKKIEIEY